MIHQILKLMDHWRGTAGALGLSLCILYLSACELTTKDPTSGEQATISTISNNVDAKAIELQAAAAEADRIYQSSLQAVTSDYEQQLRVLADIHVSQTTDLQTQLDLLATNYENAVADLERKAAQRSELVSVALNTLGVVHPGLAGAIGASGLLAALGLGYDNRRKDKTIKRLKGKTP